MVDLCCEPDNVELIGHRGQRIQNGPPENTVASVDAALAAGAEGVEVDVRLTADGVAVCLHDPDLLRVAGLPNLVRHLTFEELRRVALVNGDVAPRLEDVTEVARGRGLLVVEVKHDPADRRPIAASVVAVLQRAKLNDKVVFSSFSSQLLDQARRLDPQLRRALVTGPDRPAAAGLRRVVAAGHAELHAHLRTVLADHEIVELARQHGCRLRCWTVNREVDARLLAVAGVACFITDDPATMRSALSRGPMERTVR